LGVTGGEEDGVDNSDVENDKLYTQPQHVAYSYTELSKVGKLFTVAAAFGNVHGVYSPGNVQLRPEILKNSQDFIEHELKTGPKPVYFVFHGGSGSPQHQIREAISYGAIKMNIDTDLQWAFWEGIQQYYKKNEGYLQAQLGNPEGAEKPNKNTMIHAFGCVRVKNPLANVWKWLLKTSIALTETHNPISTKSRPFTGGFCFAYFAALNQPNPPDLILPH